MTAPEADLFLGGRYRLLDPIAAGGMGTVWRAHDERLGRKVAVKVLNEGLADDPRFLERFRREAQAAAGLAHPNVAGVFDYGDEGSRPYIVMELVEGSTLAERLAVEGALEPAEAARIAAGVADALAEAHAAGLVHRDVKPANVILSSRGTVKVTDFGIASSSQTTSLTATGMVMGTARYLSPEQARGDRATPKSDLYAVGVLLYEMLTGAPPFDGETPVATAMAHMQEAPRPIREVRPDVPEGLAAIAEACLRKDPAARPGSAAILAAELRGEDAGAAAGAAIASAAASRGATTEAIVRDPTRALTPPGGVATARRRGSVWPWLAPVLIIVLAAAAILLIIRLTDREPPKVAVPGFGGLTRAEAVARAERAGLDLTFTQEESDVPEGVVIAQSPRAGTRLAQGSTVALVLSSGPPPTLVPPLRGLDSEAEIVAALEAAGLEFGGIEFVEGPPGIVGTQPPEGTEVPRGSSVIVLVGDPDGGNEGGGNGGGGEGGGNGGGKDKNKDDD